jgi:2-polyprenyl-3-methyl-5-hydroxy-6-metoxy-1,4-benzoquinol methylase
MASSASETYAGNIAGNFYDKHGTANPVARYLVGGFYRAFDDLLAASGARKVHEIGCGEGVLCLRAAAMGCEVSGSDLEPAAIEEARRRARGLSRPPVFSLMDIYSVAPASMSDAGILVCCEVMEHLPDPEKALDTLADSGAPMALLSVPREPIWRALNVARGRYLADWGNTPGHLNHWSRHGFLSFVSRRFDIVATRAPLPWTFVLARPRHPR